MYGKRMTKPYRNQDYTDAEFEVHSYNLKVKSVAA